MFNKTIVGQYDFSIKLVPQELADCSMKNV